MRARAGCSIRAAGAGALQGAAAWLTFGLLEHLCLSVLPAWRESSLLLTPPARALSLAATLTAYSLAGALLAGAVSGAAAWLGFGRREPAVARRSIPDLATSTLVLAWIPHLVSARHFSRSAYLGLAVAALLLAALAARVVARNRRVGRLAEGLATPAAASLCLLAPLVVRDQLHLSELMARVGPHASTVKAGVAAAGTLLIVLLALAKSALRRPPVSGGSPRLVTAALLALVLIAAGSLLDRAAFRRLGVPEQPGAAGGRRAADGARGIVLVTLDAVRADHLTPYGYALSTAPNLASFASHATLYLDAHAASDMSLGTHASIFTGKYPTRHGAWVGGAFPVGRPLPASERTIAERLGEAGWVRFGAVANGYFLNRAYGLSRGFQLFDVPPADRLELRSRLGELVRRLTRRAPAVHRPASEVNAVVVEGLAEARASGRRFLAFANYMDAHDPYTPDRRFLGRFPGYDPSLPARVGRFIGAEGARRVFDERERRHLVSLYDSAIASLDRDLGLLFDRMRALGLYDASLIVVLADHGEMLGERGVFGHGTGLVDEVLRVPLIVKYPFQREARRVAAPVGQVDLLPTLLEVAGLPRDETLDGLSLLGVEGAGRRIVLAESPPARAVIEAGATRVEQIPWPPGSATPDPEGVDRLKSLGYVR